MKNDNTSESIINYETSWTIYGMDWCNYIKDSNSQRLLISSVQDEYTNKIQILNFNESDSKINMEQEINVTYPPTKVMWIPDSNNFQSDIFAYSGDYLRIYRITDALSTPIVDAILNKDNSPDRCSPVSSFDWNTFNTNIIGATSLDSTCTLWDIDKQQPITKLKAHNCEVYDIAFSNSTADVFLTAGKDGSIRLFDQRCIEHYSTVFQSATNTPVLRAAWDTTNSSTIACTMENCNDITLIDIRKSQQYLMLHSHQASVNAIAWSPLEDQYLISVSDDANCFIWDFAQLSKDADFKPSYAFSTNSAINNISWSKQKSSWIALASGKKLQVCHI